MVNKRKYSDDDSPDREIKIPKHEHESIKKHSLDSDEEDSDQEKKGRYEILHDDDIEGQEEGMSGIDGEIKITPFNMKEEMEEGHFDTEGNFHWNKDNEIRDNWQDNIDWMKVEELSNYKAKDLAEDSMDSTSQSPFDQVAVYKQILEYMEPGETILKALKRLGGNKSLSASERLKRKKAGLSIEDKGDSTKVTELTELANRILTKTGNMNVYQESYQYIKKMIESRPGPSNYDDALDMYADDFDEKEKERMENKATQPSTTEQSKQKESNEKEEEEENEVLMWEYKLEKDGEKIHGPHTTEQMQKYVEEGFFKGEIWVRKVGQNKQFYSSRRIDFQLYL